MKLFNDKFKNQKFATSFGTISSDEEGVIEVTDKELIQFFLDQGWSKKGGTKNKDEAAEEVIVKKTETKEDEPEPQEEESSKRRTFVRRSK